MGETTTIALLHEWRNGRQDAGRELFERMQPELRRLAGIHMRHERPGHTLDLHFALEKLEQLDARAAQVVELRYFGGLTENEIAEVLGISTATVRRDWNAGRAFLIDRIS